MAADSDAIFLIGEGNQLSRVNLEPYENEDLFQRLIADHPEILAGDQIDSGSPVRWLLVCREAGIPAAAAGYDHFAVDHLLLDQAGIPTFVEVKRSTDTRIRRELVGQMLDYAANAQRYWPADRMRELAAQQCDLEELHARIAESAAETVDPATIPDVVERYWAIVEENLRSGRVRLLFVADVLPPELRRIIEFLNEQMPRVQVLGVELRQYVGPGVRALVPRVIGQTEAVRQRKSAATASRLGVDDLVACCTEELRESLRELLAETQRKGLILSSLSTSIALRARRASGKPVTIAYLYAPSSNEAAPRFAPYFEYLNAEEKPEEVRRQLLATAPFAEKGRYTLELPIIAAHRAAIERAFQVLWRAASDISSRTNDTAHPAR